MYPDPNSRKRRSNGLPRRNSLNRFDRMLARALLLEAQMVFLRYTLQFHLASSQVHRILLRRLLSRMHPANPYQYPIAPQLSFFQHTEASGTPPTPPVCNSGFFYLPLPECRHEQAERGEGPSQSNPSNLARQIVSFLILFTVERFRDLAGQVRDAVAVLQSSQILASAQSLSPSTAQESMHPDDHFGALDTPLLFAFTREQLGDWEDQWQNLVTQYNLLLQLWQILASAQSPGSSIEQYSYPESPSGEPDTPSSEPSRKRRRGLNFSDYPQNDWNGNSPRPPSPGAAGGACC